MTSSNDLAAGSRLRSAHWYAGDDRNGYIHRAWMRRGVPGDAFTGRPHIAIANTASDLTPCNAHLTEVATSVPQTPTRSTSTTTSPGAATGAGTSCTSPSPDPVRTYARMVRVLIAVIISFARSCSPASTPASLLG